MKFRLHAASGWHDMRFLLLKAGKAVPRNRRYRAATSSTQSRKKKNRKATRPHKNTVTLLHKPRSQDLRKLLQLRVLDCHDSPDTISWSSNMPKSRTHTNTSIHTYHTHTHWRVCRDDSWREAAIISTVARYQCHHHHDAKRTHDCNALVFLVISCISI